MRPGYMVDLIHRFNNIKRNSYDLEKKLESLNQLISDVEEACEMPIDDNEAMQEFIKNNVFLYNVYLDFIEEREETEDDLVLD